MPRNAREKSSTGIYHIMLRGINRQVIFEDDEDREKLLETIRHYKKVSNYQIYGYCLMDNHVHLLIKEEIEPLSLVMKRICGRFVYLFNSKYDRCGHLFQERYKSETVESDTYFLTVLRYIHQNPLKAGITKKVSDYKWSSYQEYMNSSIITDVDFALGMFSSNNRQKAIELFVDFTNTQNNDKCLEHVDKMRVPDIEIKDILASQYSVSNINHLHQLDRQKRHEIIKAMKLLEGVTARQLSRVTGISKSTIDRI